MVLMTSSKEEVKSAKSEQIAWDEGWELVIGGKVLD